MNMLLRQARRLARSGGLPGVVAGGLLAFALAVLLSSIVPFLERAREAKIEQQRLAALQNAVTGGRAVALTPSEQLAEFYRFFGSADERTDMLARIHKLARSQNLEVLQGSYRFGGTSGGRLSRYELGLPLRGTYPQIRAFVATVLNEVPSAALEQISFEKQKIGDPTVEAQLKLVLFFDAAPRAGR